ANHSASDGSTSRQIACTWVTIDVSTSLRRGSGQFAIRAMTASVAVRSLKFLTSDRRLRAGFEVVTELAGIRQVGDAPAVEIVFGETRVRETFEPVGVAGGHRPEERI